MSDEKLCHGTSRARVTHPEYVMVRQTFLMTGEEGSPNLLTLPPHGNPATRPGSQTMTECCFNKSTDYPQHHLSYEFRMNSNKRYILTINNDKFKAPSSNAPSATRTPTHHHRSLLIAPRVPRQAPPRSRRRRMRMRFIDKTDS